MEGLHDLLKQIVDQTIDAGTIVIVPFGFYRPSSSVKPEVMRLEPGILIPTSDPSRDISFPTIGNQPQQAMGLNMMTVLSGYEDRLTSISDLQHGRVPTGKSSALRTSIA